MKCHIVLQLIHLKCFSVKAQFQIWLHALPLVLIFIVVHPCFISCDSPLLECLSFIILLQKLHATCKSANMLHVLTCKLLAQSL
jgi:hypothetical protein